MATSATTTGTSTGTGAGATGSQGAINPGWNVGVPEFSPASPSTPSNSIVTPSTAPTVPTNTPGNTPSIVSTTGVESEFNDASSQLDSLMANSVQNGYSLANANYQQAVSNATAKAANGQNLVGQEGAAENYGIRAEGESTGEARYEPGQLQNALSSAQASIQSKYASLSQAESLALAAANTARNNADVQTMNENIKYIQAIQNEQNTVAAEAFKEYAFNNLSADQRAALGISSGDESINAQKLQLQQWQAANPLTTVTQGSPSALTPFKGLTTTTSKVGSAGNTPKPVYIGEPGAGGNYVTVGSGYTIGGVNYTATSDGYYTSSTGKQYTINANNQLVPVGN